MSDPNVDPANAPDLSTPAEAERPEVAAEPDPFAVLEKLKAENADLKDQAARALAEMENVRRRTDKEVADSKVYGVSSFAREMLTVTDNLRRALASVPPQAREEGPEALKNLAQGVELTERDMLSRLARFNIRPLEPEGKKFDPNMHEALFELPDETVPAGTVMQVVEQGFSIGGRVLRPAKVGVSRGGPKG